MISKKELYKNMPDIVRGHEIWLEHEAKHVHVGEFIECKLLYGHNMKIDGVAVAENVKATVFGPANDKCDMIIDAGDDGLIGRFIPVIDGYHTIAVEYDAGIYTITEDGWQKGPKKNYEKVKSSGYYYQYAKTIIPGHGSKDHLNPIIGTELEIIPVDFRHYHAGEDIELKVMYEGAALAECVITAVTNSKMLSSITNSKMLSSEGDAVEATTDSDGNASIRLDKSGNWMFKAKHADPRKGIEDQFDEKVITAIFTVMRVH